MRSVLAWLGRAAFAAAVAAPGVGLFAIYARRIWTLRLEPSRSPGTPGETATALMVIAILVVCLLFARAILRGRVPGPVGAGGFMSVAVVTAVMGLAFLRA